MKKIDKIKEKHLNTDITVDSMPVAPTDMIELERSLFSKETNDYETVSLGDNRGQKFVRLPTRMTNKIGFKTGEKIKVILIMNDKQKRIILEAQK